MGQNIEVSTDFPRQARGIFRLLKLVFPLSIRKTFRAIHQQFIFKRAIHKFRKNYHLLEQMPGLVDDLIYGWGNMGWSSYRDFTQAIVRQMTTTTGPVLECGSGLSTILMGIISEDRKVRVYSLEHNREWFNLVSKKLKALNIKQPIVYHTPLKSYGEYDWYNLNGYSLPRDFRLVICDGPPHDTRGGRLGLMPVMNTSLAEGCIILLDDYQRKQEQDLVKTWQNQYKLSLTIQGTRDHYAQMYFETAE